MPLTFFWIEIISSGYCFSDVKNNESLKLVVACLDDEKHLSSSRFHFQGFFDELRRRSISVSYIARKTIHKTQNIEQLISKQLKLLAQLQINIGRWITCGLMFTTVSINTPYTQEKYRCKSKKSNKTNSVSYYSCCKSSSIFFGLDSLIIKWCLELWFILSMYLVNFLKLPIIMVEFSRTSSLRTIIEARYRLSNSISFLLAFTVFSELFGGSRCSDTLVISVLGKENFDFELAEQNY